MKSKSQSAASAKSTPKSVRQTISQSGKHLAIGLLCWAMAGVTGCYMPPELKSANASEPSPVLTPVETESPISRTISLTLQTPTPGWALEPLAVYEVEGEIWCLQQLHAPQGMVAQMISSVSGEISFTSDLPVDAPARHFVLGKTWKWDSDPQVTFLDSLDSIESELAQAVELPLAQAGNGS